MKYDELLKEYKKLAKRADQRLSRLETLAGQEHYKGVLNYSYKRAMRDINAWSGSGATRFNTKAPGDYMSLQAKVNDIKQFLDVPTSTKSGITSIYKKRAETVNERYGTDFTWQDLANYYENEDNKKLDEAYGSKTLIKALGVIKSIGNEAEAIKKAKKKNVKLDDNEVVNEIAKKLLKQGYTSEKLFKS